MGTLKSCFKPLFFFLLMLFLFNSCSDVKSEKSGNKEFERSKKLYIRSYAGSEEEKKAIDGMITSSLDYKTAYYSYEAAVKAKSLSQERRAIEKMGRFAQTPEEIGEVQEAKRRLGDLEKNLKDEQ